MSGLVQGGEIIAAIEASAEHAARVGYDEALAELGFDGPQLRLAMRGQAIHYLRRVPINATLIELEAAIGAGGVEGVIAGIRLGRMYGPDAGKLQSLAELAIQVLKNERERTGVDEWDESDPRCFLFNEAAEVLGL